MSAAGPWGGEGRAGGQTFGRQEWLGPGTLVPGGPREGLWSVSPACAPWLWDPGPGTLQGSAAHLRDGHMIPEPTGWVESRREEERVVISTCRLSGNLM